MGALSTNVMRNDVHPKAFQVAMDKNVEDLVRLEVLGAATAPWLRHQFHPVTKEVTEAALPRIDIWSTQQVFATETNHVPVLGNLGQLVFEPWPRTTSFHA